MEDPNTPRTPTDEELHAADARANARRAKIRIEVGVAAAEAELAVLCAIEKNASGPLDADRLTACAAALTALRVR